MQEIQSLKENQAATFSSKNMVLSGDLQKECVDIDSNSTTQTLGMPMNTVP